MTGQMYSKMIFDDGYVHCDPHPGNVLVNKGISGGTEIVLLDHGLYTQLNNKFRSVHSLYCTLYTQLNNKFRYDYADFWLAIINRDVEAIKTSADKLGVGKCSRYRNSSSDIAFDVKVAFMVSLPVW